MGLERIKFWRSNCGLVWSDLGQLQCSSVELSALIFYSYYICFNIFFIYCLSSRVHDNPIKSVNSCSVALAGSEHGFKTDSVLYFQSINVTPGTNVVAYDHADRPIEQEHNDKLHLVPFPFNTAHPHIF